MRIDKDKRIGKVIVFVEGEVDEFVLIEEIFHRFLGYKLTELKRSEENLTFLLGRKGGSEVFLLNTPSSNLSSVKNATSFNDEKHNLLVRKLDLDTTNYPVYYLFDRDVLSNREGLARNLLSELNASQNDSEEQNGLLLLSYPAIESFLISMNEEGSFHKMFRLGKEEKKYVKERGYSPSSICEESLLRATKEFLACLKNEGLLEEGNFLSQMDKLGTRIFEFEREVYQRERRFHCLSQLTELLIDLGILALD